MGLSLAEEFADRLDALSDDELAAIEHDWRFWRRPEQALPPGKDWWLFLLLGGRGGGKSRAGSEAVREWVYQGVQRIALVGPTTGDVVRVMLRGESGILNVFPEHQRPKYIPSQSRVVFHNGACAYIYSSETPDRLRGPQHEKALCDELAAWPKLEETWSNLRFGLRLGDAPQIVVTTTPRPLDILRDWLKQSANPSSGIRVSRLKTIDNARNLAPGAVQQLYEEYGGTRLGLQELDGEILEPAGAVFSKEWFQTFPGEIPHGGRTVVGVDPAMTARHDETGIVCVRRIGNRYYVLADESGQMGPDEWGRKAIEVADRYGATTIVAETSIGGDLVTQVLRSVRPNVHVSEVRAKKGKATRAEPVSTLYEQRKVWHRPGLRKLEDQLVSFESTTTEIARAMKRSRGDDRVDALVWAITELKPHLHLTSFEAADIRLPSDRE